MRSATWRRSAACRAGRYDVQEGLIPAPLGVGRGNHYTAEHLEQLLRVKALQEGGQTLDEIRRALGKKNAARSVHAASTPAASLTASYAPIADSLFESDADSRSGEPVEWRVRESRAFEAPSFLRRFKATSDAARVAPPRGMDLLVALQEADGSWALDAALAAVIGRDLIELEGALAGAGGSPDECRRAWATALAMAWLQIHAVDVAVEWRMLGAKAQAWINDIAAVPPPGWTWIDRAREFLEGTIP